MNLLPSSLLRRPGPPEILPAPRVQIDDPRLAAILSPTAPLLRLHAGLVHAEGPVWQQAHHRLVFSDVANRRLLAWHEDGSVTVLLEGTWFMNGNALAPDGTLWHCEHGRRCISRSPPGATLAMPDPIVTHYEGARLNSPNDVVVAPDGAVWFTDPIFGIVMPSQGALAVPELSHRSLYRYDPATTALRRMADFEQPNGLAFAPGGRTLYVSDTSLSLGEVPGYTAGTRHEVQAFEVATDATLSNRRLFAHAGHGYPDGLKVDARSWVWVTGADGIHIWSPAREKLGYIPTQAPVANLAFAPNRLFLAAGTQLLAIDLLE